MACNSAALVADAAHSIGDLVSDAITIAALRAAKRPPDSEYPFGYGRFETLGALAVGGLLVFSSIGAGAHACEILVPMLREGHVAATSDFPPIVIMGVLVAVGSIGAKEWLFRATHRIGVAQRSQVLIANAWHHRTDSISSVVVLVALAGAWAGVPVLDPLAGMGVAGMIMRVGWQMSWEAVRELADHSTSDLELAALQGCVDDLVAARVLVGAHNIRARRVGQATLVEMHVQVDPKLTVSAAHSNAEKSRLHVLDKIPHVTDVLVHVDVDHSEDQFHDSVMPRPPVEIEQDVVATVLASCPEVRAITHIRLHFVTGRLLVELELDVSDDQITVRDARCIAGRARDAILKIDVIDAVDIHLELSVDGA